MPMTAIPTPVRMEANVWMETTVTRVPARKDSQAITVKLVGLFFSFFFSRYHVNFMMKTSYSYYQ